MGVQNGKLLAVSPLFYTAQSSRLLAGSSRDLPGLPEVVAFAGALFPSPALLYPPPVSASHCTVGAPAPRDPRPRVGKRTKGAKFKLR